MTALNPATQIPAYVNTVEKCLAWCASILADLNPTQSIVTAPGQSEQLAQSYPLFFTSNTPQQYRLVCVAYLELPNNFRESGLQARVVKELKTDAIPAAYTAA